MTQAPNQKAKDTLELRRQQRQRTPEAIAETYRLKQERDAQEIAEQAAADRLSKYARDNGDWEANIVTQNRFEDNRKTEAKYVDADWARQQAEFERDKKAEEALKQKQRAERAEKGQTPRGVSFVDTSLAQKPESHEYTPDDFCEALKWDESRLSAIRRAIKTWGKGTKRGIRWALTKAEAEAFWLWYKQSRHEKAHPPRQQQNSAQIARST